ncbi:glycosyltransferase family 1 protein [Halorubrum sp. GN11_10-6_MGM]|uniref:glycosyltransferase family 4 protein n=1 Tax=Halorubrum sp. GN11_10-6_MGM TaxID=2518112 RepID=UPI0010F5CAC7|nr:glycosyltransferase family 4 protein [Halorubrum sp. GN11_10-6_MGM]TKX74494.1 glycosyltransferase family 1 protein [Halorubrum sp. GN11_10-6_MGM]
MNDKSVILLTHVDLNGTSGANIATRNLVESLSDRSHLRIVSPTSTYEKAVSHKELPSKTEHPYLFHIIAQPLLVIHFLSLVLTHRPDLVVTRYHPTLLFPGILSYLVQTDHVFLVRGHFKTGIPTWILPMAVVNIYMNVLTSTEVLVAYTEIERGIDNLPLLSTRHVSLAPNAVNPTKFKPISNVDIRSQYDISDSTFVIGFVGSFRKRHQLTQLIEGFNLVQQSSDSVHLLLVGDGPRISHLKNIARNLGINDKITFTGYVEHEIVQEYMNICDVLYAGIDSARPSNPIKCYEYLACAKPIIVTRSSEFEFINKIQCGVLLSDHTPSEICDNIVDIQDLSSSQRKAMGERGRKYVIENHTWESRAVQILGITADS